MAFYLRAKCKLCALTLQQSEEAYVVTGWAAVRLPTRTYSSYSCCRLMRGMGRVPLREATLRMQHICVHTAAVD